MDMLLSYYKPCLRQILNAWFSAILSVSIAVLARSMQIVGSPPMPHRWNQPQGAVRLTPQAQWKGMDQTS